MKDVSSSGWQSFKSLTGSKRRWLIIAALLLPLTAVALRFLGLRRLQSVIARRFPVVKSHPSTADIAKARAIADMVAIAARRGVYPATCLHASILLWGWLRQMGTDSNLRIGVHKDEDLLEAHAWIECQGEVLNDTADPHQRYAAFEGQTFRLKS